MNVRHSKQEEDENSSISSFTPPRAKTHFVYFIKLTRPSIELSHKKQEYLHERVSFLNLLLLLFSCQQDNTAFLLYLIVCCVRQACQKLEATKRCFLALLCYTFSPISFICCKGWQLANIPERSTYKVICGWHGIVFLAATCYQLLFARSHLQSLGTEGLHTSAPKMSCLCVQELTKTS